MMRSHWIVFPMFLPVLLRDQRYDPSRILRRTTVVVRFLSEASNEVLDIAGP
jgi:hypothetical protein